MIWLLKISLLPRGLHKNISAEVRNESVIGGFQAFWHLECWGGCRDFIAVGLFPDLRSYVIIVSCANKPILPWSLLQSVLSLKPSRYLSELLVYMSPLPQATNLIALLTAESLPHLCLNPSAWHSAWKVTDMDYLFIKQVI